METSTTQLDINGYTVVVINVCKLAEHHVMSKTHLYEKCEKLTSFLNSITSISSE